MNENLKKFLRKLRGEKLDGFIVTNPVNIFYLSGFRGVSVTERESLLIFNPQPTLITARLYQSEARSLASKSAGWRIKIKIVDERDKIYKFAQELLKKNERVGFEENDLKYTEYRGFEKVLQPSSSPYLSSSRKRGSDTSQAKSKDSRFRGNDRYRILIPTRNLIEEMRAIKTEDEIAKIEKAQIISQKAFEKLIKTVKPGQTEGEIAERLAKIIKSLGGQGLAFETIIASGPNSGLPHHRTGDRKIKNGDVLLLDFGAYYQNYCADLSRTIFIDKAKDEHKNIYNHVANAQKAAIDKITHGVKSSHIHNTANDIFKSGNLHDYFIHGLGHGVGLEVHETPHLRASVDDPLSESMVFSVEPGLYFPWGGVRIEDLVTIRNGKARVLGKLQEKLVEIV